MASIDVSFTAALHRRTRTCRTTSCAVASSLRVYAFATLLGVSGAQAGSGELDAHVLRVVALEADIDFGEYLAGECAGCHVPAGETTVPIIHGIERDAIVRALLEFQRGVRENETMRSLADALLDEDIAALALYLSGGES